MPLLVAFSALVLLFAVAGDLATPTLRPGRPFVMTGWVGATAGALMPLFALNVLFAFPFFVDPLYVITQEVLVAGIVGGLVDVPMTVYRNRCAGVPAERTVREAAAVAGIVGLLVVGLVAYRLNFEPAQLMI